MTLKMLGAASAAILLAATSAQAAPAKKAASPTPAATAPAPAPLPPLINGPPIAGVCIYNRDAAVAASAAGKAAAARMQQLRAQVSAELQAEQTALQTDAQAFQAKRATLTQEQIQSQVAPLQQRGEALDRKAQLRQRELEVTGEKALQRFDQTVVPIVRNLYQQHNCSLLLGAGVMAANPQMDLTELAVQQVNLAMPTMTFDRENLPQQ